MAHILDSTNATTTRCGIKRKDDEALPFVLAQFVPMHVAGHGRDAVLVDLDERNAELAQQRIGMFLTVEHHSAEGVA